MALTVGTDSYISLADAETYATEHFIGDDKTTWDAASDADKEAALRQATQYVDAKFRDRFLGHIQSTSQALEWPRAAAFDRSGRTLTGTPDAVKDTVVELAKERIAAGDNIVPVEERGGLVKRERVEGAVEVEYFDGAPSGRTYQFAEMLLSQVLERRANKLVRV